MVPFRIRHSDRIVAGFLLFAVIATCAVVLVVVKNQGLFKRRVTFHTIFEDGGGLKPETPVKIAGIEVGTVRKVRLTDDDKVEVTFEVLEEYRDRIVSDPPGDLCKRKAAVDVLLNDQERKHDEDRKRLCGSRVAVSLPAGLGAFLQAGIEIKVGNKSANAVVEDGGFVPAEESEGIGELVQRLAREGVVQSAKDIVVQIDTLLKNINDKDGDVQKSIAHVEQVSGRFAKGEGLVGEITRDDSKTMAQVTGALQRLDNTLAKLEAASADAALLVNDVSKRRGDIDKFVTNLETFSSDAKQVSADLKTVAADAKQIPPDVREAVKNLDERIDELGKVIHALRKSNPFGLAEDDEPKSEEKKP